MSDYFSYDAPEEIGGGGNFLKEPGTYHILVKEVRGGIFPGGKKVISPPGGFCFEGKVLAGTVGGVEGAELGVTLFNGKPDSKDGGNFARVKQGAFFIATGLLQPEQLGKPGLNIDLSQAKGQQIVITLEADTVNTDKQYLQLAGASIYHVDDPRVADMPKSGEYLALIPPTHRRSADFFAKLSGRKAAAASGQPGAATTAAAGLSADQLDSL